MLKAYRAVRQSAKLESPVKSLGAVMEETSNGSTSVSVASTSVGDTDLEDGCGTLSDEDSTTEEQSGKVSFKSYFVTDVMCPDANVDIGTDLQDALAGVSQPADRSNCSVSTGSEGLRSEVAWHKH